MTPEVEERIARLKAEIDAIRKENKYTDAEGKLHTYETPQVVEVAIRNRCRKILKIQGMPIPTYGGTITLLRAVGYIVDGPKA